MSHELRTPLNGVIAVTDLLAKTSLSPHQTELTSLIQSSSNQLRRLVGDILDLSRIESGELVLAESSMSVVEIVDDVVRLSALGAEAKGLALRTTIAPDVAGAVLGDALKLKQVLTNLISNAVKFTESGMVEVRVSRSESIYRFDVSDTGIGFSEEQRSLIFERFQQADGSITRKFGGTGLGLAISRQLVAIMGGRLECRATPGKGADFWFSVPFKTSLTSCVEEGPAQEANLDVTTVLVVDDNATNRRVAELLLNSIGAQVISVEDGEQAVSAFMQGRYDVILMDMMMPVMDGIAATRAIRQLEVDQCLHRTPIAMLTANTLPEHTAKSLDAGADLHLSKPINATELVQALQFLIGDNEPVPSH